MAKIILDAETEEPADPQIAYVDGYHFGDRLLEGVMFEITLDEDRNVVCKGVVAGDKDYMKKFSKAQMAEWCEAAVEAANDDMLTDITGQRDMMLDEVP